MTETPVVAVEQQSSWLLFAYHLRNNSDFFWVQSHMFHFINKSAVFIEKPYVEAL